MKLSNPVVFEGVTYEELKLPQKCKGKYLSRVRVSAIETGETTGQDVIDVVTGIYQIPDGLADEMDWADLYLAFYEAIVFLGEQSDMTLPQQSKPGAPRSGTAPESTDSSPAS